MILSLSSSIFEVFTLVVLKNFLSLLNNERSYTSSVLPNHNLLFGTTWHQLQIIGLAFIILLIASSSLRSICIAYQLRLSNLIVTDLGSSAFDTLTRKSYEWHISTTASSLTAELTKTLDQIYEICICSLSLVTNAVYCIFVILALFVFSTKLMILVSPLIVSLYLLVHKYTKSSQAKDGKTYTDSHKNILAICSNTFNNIEQIQAHNYLDKPSKDFALASRRHRIANSLINTKAQLPRYIIEAIIITIFTGIVIYYASTTSDLSKVLPQFGLVFLGIYRVLQPIQQCFSAYSSISSHSPSLENLTIITSSNEPGIQKDRNSLELITTIATKLKSTRIGDTIIQVKNVNSHLFFNYRNKTPVSVTINNGDKLLICGNSGSGKSSFIKIMAGMIKPCLGSVELLGIDTVDIYNSLLNNRESSSSVFTYVPQKTVLTDASIAENIAVTDDLQCIDFDLLEEVARICDLTTFIQSLSSGWYTHVGDDGKRISGGQKQRIGLARAMYRRPMILVLDEATSALDKKTEAIIMENITHALNSKIIIAVTHSLQNYPKFTKILQF